MTEDSKKHLRTILHKTIYVQNGKRVNVVTQKFSFSKLKLLEVI